VPLIALSIIFLIPTYATAATYSVNSSTDWQNEGTFHNTTTFNNKLLLDSTIIQDTVHDGDIDEYAGETGDAEVVDSKDYWDDNNSYSIHLFQSSSDDTEIRRDIPDMTPRNLTVAQDANGCFHFGWDSASNDGKSNDFQFNYNCGGSDYTVDINNTQVIDKSFENGNGGWVRFTMSVDWAAQTVDKVYENGTVVGTDFDFSGGLTNVSYINMRKRGGGSGEGWADYIAVKEDENSQGNWTGNTKSLGSNTKKLEAFQVDVNKLSSGSHLDAILKAKDTSNTTIDAETCHFSTFGRQNLSCASSLEAFNNFRFSFNMTSGSTPEVDSATVFYNETGTTINDSDVWVNESGDRMTGDLDMSDNNIWDVGTMLIKDSLDMGGNPIKNLDMSGNPIKNLPTPQKPSDAATKSYVDNNTRDKYVDEKGDNVTGDLSFNDNSVLDLFKLETNKLTATGSDVIVTSNLQFTSTHEIKQLSKLRVDRIDGLESANNFKLSETLHANGEKIKQAQFYNLQETNKPVNCNAGDIRFNNSVHWGCNGTHWNQMY